MSQTEKTMLVIGATGQQGSAIVLHLLTDGGSSACPCSRSLHKLNCIHMLIYVK